jgi:magnesium-transporting ATPase (P-type)
MSKIFKNHGLLIILLLLFFVSVLGQFFQGMATYNQERALENLASLSQAEYLHSGHFISSIAENMESEFLQMSLFVFLTMCFIQKGSAESKKPPEEMTEEDLDEERKEEEYSKKQNAKYPFWWKIYESSLTIALTTLFLIFFFMHAYGSMKYINTEHVAHNQKLITFWGVFKEPEFWFESFQNWQSEFFSIAVISTFSIFLRQKNSSQSKKLMDPNWKTGNG